jgi:hypothetical protein
MERGGMSVSSKNAKMLAGKGSFAANNILEN